MFGFIWVLLEKIATKILKDQLGIMERGLVTRERDIERLEEIADARRSDLIELRAKLDGEIDILKQTMREQAKCIKQQEEAMRAQAKCIEQATETIRVLRVTQSGYELDAKRKEETIKELNKKIEARDSLVDELSAKIHAARQDLA